jgi:hypothetical protein
VAGSCEYSDEPSGSGATELVCFVLWRQLMNCCSETEFGTMKDHGRTYKFYLYNCFL